MKATITTLGNMVFLNFFNSTRVYSIKGFDTIKKANNYAKKYNYEIFKTLPIEIKQFTYND